MPYYTANDAGLEWSKMQSNRPLDDGAQSNRTKSCSRAYSVGGGRRLGFFFFFFYLLTFC
jgi:hypothetical protein